VLIISQTGGTLMLVQIHLMFAKILLTAVLVVSKCLGKLLVNEHCDSLSVWLTA